ncbi:MAG: SDR family oxidoreductase [Kordiimonadaceae bacterium]|nr:SDR family oxidoreductase [Kordiimonadaceae bacterium]MBO6569647.1 SDR family oxidoreductase [Kordiimonadaceae bacterium]MBO6966182.1 SDR family oxidoreductase [Kordiimonadaceae bacterium]
MGKVAIITGGSRGIGAATAVKAAKAGYGVCLSYVSDATAAEAVVATCIEADAQALAVQADVANQADVKRLFEACDTTLGAATLLVNNAGIVGQMGPFPDLPADALKRTFAVNVFGAMYAAQEAANRMATSKGGNGGVIINVSSMASRLGSAGEYVHYAASKGAIDSFTIGLAKELGPDGIRVNAVRSGTVGTEVHQRDGNPDRPGMVAETAPLRRVGKPDDIAGAILWLASDEAGYATGSILDVTGGL